MTIRLIIFLLFCSQLISAQYLEFVGDLSKYDYGLEDELKYSNSAKTEVGYGFHISLNDVQFGLEELKGVNFNFTFGVNKSKSEFSFRSGGQGGGSITGVKTQKTVIVIGIYPFNFKLFQRFELNFGANYMGTLSSNALGSNSSFGLAGNNVRIIDNEGDFFSKNQFGVTGRLAYKIKFNDNTSLIPQYNYYLGLSKEFNRYISTTSIQNHFLGIGITRKL